MLPPGGCSILIFSIPVGITSFSHHLLLLLLFIAVPAFPAPVLVGVPVPVRVLVAARQGAPRRIR